jgi:hypothetical protein
MSKGREYEKYSQNREIEVKPQVWTRQSAPISSLKPLPPYELVFEGNFEDSLLVFYKGEPIEKGHFRITGNTKPSVRFLFINDNISKPEQVAIVNPTKKVNVLFHLSPKYKFYYINFFNGTWAVECSNERRGYE